MSSATLPLVTNVRLMEASAPFKLGYRPALDGVRGFAILGVLAFHTHHIFNWSLLRGGNIGVDIFFVLSGFLITTLLVEEWGDTGTVSLKSFYWRRVLRLVPAFLVLLATLYFLSGVFLSASQVDDTKRAMPIAFLYASDFALAFFNIRLGALQHTWSLAIEEHFYLIWPVFLVAALRLGVSKKRLIMITLILALASALHRATLHQLGAPPVRTYYGIDTRADGLLIGCAAGMAVSWGFIQNVGLKALVLALTFITICLFIGDYASTFMHLGGFALLAIATAVVLASVVLSASRNLLRLLEFGPLVWVGRISYGLYLWHYAVFKATSFLSVSWPLQLTVALACTLAVTCLSYYLIERPALSLKWRQKEAQKVPITARQ